MAPRIAQKYLSSTRVAFPSNTIREYELYILKTLFPMTQFWEMPYAKVHLEMRVSVWPSRGHLLKYWLSSKVQGLSKDQHCRLPGLDSHGTLQLHIMSGLFSELTLIHTSTSQEFCCLYKPSDVFYVTLIAIIPPVNPTMVILHFWGEGGWE